jgi:hypothetical protein
LIDLIDEFERDENDPAYEHPKVERETYKEDIEAENRRRIESKKS